MTIKNKLDPEIKIELLIKLAFGIPIEDLAIEYDLSKSKIINLRKNNYILFNRFFDHWKIDKEVSALGLVPKYERALSIVKKFYKNKVTINEEGSILYNGIICAMPKIVQLADEILKKDNINCFLDLPPYIKNYY